MFVIIVMLYMLHYITKFNCYNLDKIIFQNIMKVKIC